MSCYKLRIKLIHFQPNYNFTSSFHIWLNLIDITQFQKFQHHIPFFQIDLSEYLTHKYHWQIIITQTNVYMIQPNELPVTFNKYTALEITYSNVSTSKIAEGVKHFRFSNGLWDL